MPTPVFARLVPTALVALALATAAAAQTTWYVDATATGPGTGADVDPFPTIQAGVDAAVDGDTVLVGPGLYLENVVTSEHIHIRSSRGPSMTTIEAHTGDAVVEMLAPNGWEAFLEGFTITGTVDSNRGGVVLNSGTVRNCIVRDVARTGGGAGFGVVVLYDGFLESCTLVRNFNGLVVEFYQGIGWIRNSIVRDNLDDDIWAPSGAAYTRYCVGDFQATYMEEDYENQDVDPQWFDGAGNDFHILPGSPCIDAGDPADTDPDGSRADIGAHAYDPDHAPAPTTYCTGKTNSQGCVPAVQSTGAPSASGAPFTIECVNVLNNKSGFLFYGYGPKWAPYQGGHLCVKGPVRRTSLQNSGGSPPPDDCTGVYSYDFDALIQSGIDPSLTAGAHVYGQFWFRDPQSADGFTTGRSDGILFEVGP